MNEWMNRIIFRGVDNLPINFSVSGTFRSPLMDQQLSDASRDLATLTFDLRGHGACSWYGSSCYVCVPSLKVVGLPLRKIWRTSGLSISRPGDLDRWPLTLKLVRIIARGVDILPTNFGVSTSFRSRRLRDTTSTATFKRHLKTHLFNNILT